MYLDVPLVLLIPKALDGRRGGIDVRSPPFSRRGLFSVVDMQDAWST